MAIANVTLNNTFDEWRTVTNQVISFVNDIDGGNLTKFYSNTAVLTVTENVARGGKNFITLNVSSNVLDTSTLNVATANAVNIVFASLANTVARVVIVSNDANSINAVANAGIIQANTARIHANAAFFQANAAFVQANTTRDVANLVFVQANAAFVQANTARDIANISFVQANAAFVQANTARDIGNLSFVQANTSRIHANVSFGQANTAYDRANAAFDLATTASGNTVPIIASNKAAFDLANAAYFQANTAYDRGNTAFFLANAGIIQANTAYDRGNVSFFLANAGIIQANTSRDLANLSFVQANTGRDSANISFVQANTARDQANAAFAKANTANITADLAYGKANVANITADLAYGKANVANITADRAWNHANAGFDKANASFSNTSGSSFVGNLQIPTGNIAIGVGTTQGIRLFVNGSIGVSNSDPQVKFINGTQFVNLNANTNISWNNLMLDRDLSITFSRGGSDDGANLVIAPWSGSSIGYKQDGAGRHGLNTSNPRYTLDANGSANISGSLLVGNQNVIPVITASFAATNVSFAQANVAFVQANAAFVQANTARDTANIVLPTFAQANTGRDVANLAFIQANAAFVQANTARDKANNAFANTTGTINGDLTVISNITATANVYDSKGDLRIIPANEKAVVYAIAKSDVGKFVTINTSSNVFVPNAVFTQGDAVSLYNNSSASMNIISNSSVTMYLGGTSTTGTRVLTQRGAATILCVFANNFVISGAGLS